MSNIRNRSSLTLSLITNGERLRKGDKVPSNVGHTQLRLHFTNQEQGRSKLISDRNTPDDKAETYPQVDTHLLVRVGEGSRKFGQYLDTAIGMTEQMAAARAELADIRGELKAIRAKMPGYAELLRKYRDAEEETKKLEREVGMKSRKNKRSREQELDLLRFKELLGFKRSERDGLDSQLDAILDANPADKARLAALLKDDEKKLSEISAIYIALQDDEEFVKDTLKRYLADERLGNLPEHKDAKQVFDLILNHQITLYSLELSGKCQTDRLGVPLAEKVRRSADGAPSTEVFPCDKELSIPWDYVFTGMTTLANNLYRPGEQGAQKHFVFANPAEAPARKEDSLANVDSVVVGCMPTYTKDRRVRGWAVIIRKRQWAEIMRNLDKYRLSGIIEQFLKFCPDPNPPSQKPSSQAVGKTEEDKPERKVDQPSAEGTSVASVPTASEAAEEPGQTAESSPVEEPRQPEEPAGTSASAAN